MRPILVCSMILLGLPGVAAAQGFSAMLAPSGGVTDSDATGSNGTGWLDGKARFDFGRGLTALFDAAGGSYDNLTSLGGRGQLYWRDPALGLLGVLAEVADRDGLTQWRTGVKGEFYLGPVTLRGQAGYVFGDAKGSLRIEDSGYGVLSGGFYGLPGIAMNGGALVQDGRTTGFGALEAEIPGLPRFLTATLNGAAGANGYGQVLVGVRLYFGAMSAVPLQQRHAGQTPGFPAFDLGATARARPAPVTSAPGASPVGGTDTATPSPPPPPPPCIPIPSQRPCP